MNLGLFTVRILGTPIGKRLIVFVGGRDDVVEYERGHHVQRA